MLFLYFSVLASIFVIAILMEKNIYSPVAIFTGTWIFVGVLSAMNLYGFLTVSDLAYGLAAGGVLCFALGGLIGALSESRVQRSCTDYGSRNRITVNYRFLIPFYLVILLFTALLASRSLRLLLSGVPMETIRFNYNKITAGIIVRTGIEYDIEHYIVTTAEFAAVALIPVLMMEKKSSRKTLLLCEMISFLGLHIFVTGARSFIFDLVFAIILYILIDNHFREKLIHKYVPKIKGKAAAIVAGATVLFVFMTRLRRGVGSSLLHEIYAYFAISFRLLDKHLDLIAMDPEYTYGMTLFHGLLRPFFLVLKAIGIPYPALYQKTIDLINANNLFYKVGKGSANSFVTVFYYFFMDFGYISVIVGCFLYGFFGQKIYMGMRKRPNKRNIAIYILFALGLFLSFVRLHFTAHRYVYAFLIIYFGFIRNRMSEY